MIILQDEPCIWKLIVVVAVYQQPLDNQKFNDDHEFVCFWINSITLDSSFDAATAISITCRFSGVRMMFERRNRCGCSSDCQEGLVTRLSSIRLGLKTFNVVRFVVCWFWLDKVWICCGSFLSYFIRILDLKLTQGVGRWIVVVDRSPSDELTRKRLSQGGDH